MLAGMEIDYRLLTIGCFEIFWQKTLMVERRNG